MFLFADLALPEAIPEWKVSELEDDNIVQRTTSTFNVSKDSGIKSNDFNSSMGNDIETLGMNLDQESRILFSFNNTVPNGDLVTDATLYLTCGTDSGSATDIKIYSSRVKKTWFEENVTWYQRDNSTSWGLPGLEGYQR